MIEYLEKILYKKDDLPGTSDKNVQFMDKIKRYNQTHKNYLEVAEETAEKDEKSGSGPSGEDLPKGEQS